MAGRRRKAARARLEDEAFIRGFGSYGGEEHVSYMMTSEALAKVGGDDWERWDQVHPRPAGAHPARRRDVARRPLHHQHLVLHRGVADHAGHPARRSARESRVTSSERWLTLRVHGG